MDDQKQCKQGARGVFSVVWVQIRIFGPDTAKFCPKNAFLGTYRPCRLIWCPVAWLLGGCCAWAVSRKTPIFFICYMLYVPLASCFLAIVILIIVDQSWIGVLTVTARPLMHITIIMFINTMVAIIKLKRYHGAMVMLNTRPCLRSDTSLIVLWFDTKCIACIGGLFWKITYLYFIINNP